MNFGIIWEMFLENWEITLTSFYLVIVVIAFLLGWKFYDKRAAAVLLESRITYALRWALFRWVPGAFHFLGFIVQLLVKLLIKLLLESSFKRENGNESGVNHRFSFLLHINGNGIKLVLIKTAEVVDSNVIHVPRKNNVLEGSATRESQ